LAVVVDDEGYRLGPRPTPSTTTAAGVLSKEALTWQRDTIIALWYRITLPLLEIMAQDDKTTVHKSKEYQ